MKNLLQKIVGLIVQPLKKSFPRFPEAIITSFLLGFLLVLVNELNSEFLIEIPWLVDINRVLFLVLPLMLLLRLVPERWPHLKSFYWVFFTSIVVVSVSLFIFLTLENIELVELNRFTNLGYAFYLLIIFVPYLMNRKDIGIGIILFFTKLFTSFFYAFMLFIGIFVVLISINVLFALQIDLIFYTNVFIVIATYIFVPSLLDAYPRTDTELTVKKDYHQVWQTVFKFVIAPVIAVFSLLVVFYLLTSFFNSSTYVATVYTFSALVIAFVGISAQVALSPITKTNTFVQYYVSYFHFILIAVMLGYYFEQFKTISLDGISLSVTIQLMLGVWPLIYAFMMIRKYKDAVHRGLLALTGAFVVIAALPGLNAVSLTTMLLNAQFQQTLVTNDMLDEDKTIIRQEILEDETYFFLLNTLDQMDQLGMHRFPLVPVDYNHPADFETVFGAREVDPVDPQDESLFYSLGLNIIDLTTFQYESLVYVSSLGDLEAEPYFGPTIQIQFTADESLHQYQLTVTREAISETFDLYTDVALILKDRFQANDRNDIQDASEMLVSLEFDTFALDIWVLSCLSTRSESFSSFSMGFYLGLSSRNG
jgi:hypothetical protein